MGNETSTEANKKVTFTKEEFEVHCSRVKDMENSIKKKDEIINNMKIDERRTSNTIRDLENKLSSYETLNRTESGNFTPRGRLLLNVGVRGGFRKLSIMDEKNIDLNRRGYFEEKNNELRNELAEALNSKELVSKELEEINVENTDLRKEIKNLKSNLDEKDIEMNKKLMNALNDKELVSKELDEIKVENTDLCEEINNLKINLEKKDIEMKKKLTEASENEKIITQKLNKYKSMPEFEALIKLNSNLVDFLGKLDSAVASNSDFLEMNDNDHEIETMKRKNVELYSHIKNNIKTLIMEDELKDAENKLNIKKDFAREEFFKVNCNLMIIMEKIAQITKNIVGTIENAMKELQTYQKEFIGLEEAGKKITDSLSYLKIKNILLQQQNAIMNEIIAKNNVISTNPNNINFKTNFPSQHLNKDDSDEDDVDIFDGDASKTNSISYKEKTFNFPSQHLNKNDSDEDDVDIFDDDASETSLMSYKEKMFKLILLNVNEEDNKCDVEKVQNILQKLTKLGLDDIEVERVGKPSGIIRPIVVGFHSIHYVREILKKRHKLKYSKFYNIGICPFKSKPTI